MSEDSQTDEPTAFPPAYSDKEIRDFVLGVCNNTIFTDRHCRHPDDLQMIFMVLALGGLAEHDTADIGCVWEYLDKAGNRGINGYPMFHSVRFMNKADADRAFAAIKKELSRREELEV